VTKNKKYTLPARGIRHLAGMGISAAIIWYFFSLAHAAAILLSLGMILFFFSILFPPFFEKWDAAIMKIVRFAGRMLTFFTVLVVYITVFVPAGICFRMFSKEMRDQNHDSSLPTYWNNPPVKDHDPEQPF
jgi:predicted membrane protein